MKYRIKSRASYVSGTATLWLQTKQLNPPGPSNSFAAGFDWLTEGQDYSGEPTTFSSHDTAMRWAKYVLFCTTITEVTVIKVE